jgi:hypothetical protein
MPASAYDRVRVVAIPTLRSTISVAGSRVNMKLGHSRVASGDWGSGTTSSDQTLGCTMRAMQVEATQANPVPHCKSPWHSAAGPSPQLADPIARPASASANTPGPIRRIPIMGTPSRTSS